jgi:hypothetical protein
MKSLQRGAGMRSMRRTTHAANLGGLAGGRADILMAAASTDDFLPPGGNACKRYAMRLYQEDRSQGRFINAAISHFLIWCKRPRSCSTALSTKDDSGLFCCGGIPR